MFIPDAGYPKAGVGDITPDRPPETPNRPVRISDVDTQITVLGYPKVDHGEKQLDVPLQTPDIFKKRPVILAKRPDVLAPAADAAYPDTVIDTLTLDAECFSSVFLHQSSNIPNPRPSLERLNNTAL
ncbi:hypothetical protein KOI40_05095 [Aestuariicella sp. G3-2]|uniref:hypothetical protein n=1 Tax=Pseudomaricurvus albidus TaxID=2842452 RepID=UPI001C0E67DA|nr:hypothetical protein [Aestuariicella albida]MBU3069186.1 hypothetical protein [Aestuariicella albida]